MAFSNDVRILNEWKFLSFLGLLLKADVRVRGTYTQPASFFCSVQWYFNGQKKLGKLEGAMQRTKMMKGIETTVPGDMRNEYL